MTNIGETTQRFSENLNLRVRRAARACLCLFRPHRDRIFRNEKEIHSKESQLPRCVTCYLAHSRDNDRNNIIGLTHIYMRENVVVLHLHGREIRYIVINTRTISDINRNAIQRTRYITADASAHIHIHICTYMYI